MHCRKFLQCIQDRAIIHELALSITTRAILPQEAVREFCLSLMALSLFSTVWYRDRSIGT